jgi:hypothetical protein
MRRPRRAEWIFVLAWIAALAPSIVYLRGLQWPCDVDGVRDVAAAQAFADGRWLKDPLYAGEAAWYTPLVPAAVALTSGVARVTVPRAYVLTGLWLNGLIPLAFFVCARRLLGSTAALAATVVYVFLPGHPVMWASGTYNPWPFPAVTAQLPFFLGLWAWIRALDTPTPLRFFTSGALLALTFLAHGAPALVLAGIVVLTTVATVVRCVGNVSRRTRVIGMLLAAGTSFVLVLPFLAPLWIRYHLHSVNRAPATWIDPDVQPAALLHVALSWPALPHWVLAAAGVWWIRRYVGAVGQRLLLAWPLATAAGYALAVVSQTVTAVPALVPAYHYTYLFRAFEAMLSGCGIMAFAALAARGFGRLRIAISSTVIAVTASAIVAVAVYPQYLDRELFDRAYKFSRGAPNLEVYRWIRGHVRPGAVFVASEDDALRLVGPAGASVISVDKDFANPYIDRAVRSAALDRMVEALRRGDLRQFEHDRQQFGVTHVLARGDEAAEMLDHSQPVLMPVLRLGMFTIFTVHPIRMSD